jgi:uncharacterized membrane protein YgdD (TMEM256/DUF423 family)
MKEQFSRNQLALGAAFAAVGVALGAFGAHGLKETVSVQMLGTFETGVRYQMYHAFALILCGLASRWGGADEIFNRKVRLAGSLFTLGIVLFSGSLYCLVLMNIPWLGAVTPLGGIAFICGWTMLAIAALGKENPEYQ